MGAYVTKRNRYRSGYANLASAIIESGINANDKGFLESDWCDTLREICRLDDVLTNKNAGVVIPKDLRSV